MSLNDTIQKIKGKEGKKSELVVLREENGEKTKKKITVTCEKIVNQTVTHRMLSGKTRSHCHYFFYKRNGKTI